MCRSESALCLPVPDNFEGNAVMSSQIAVISAQGGLKHLH